MAEAMILSGAGRYADPWHPYAATSEALAGILEQAGYGVRIDDDVDRALARIGDAELLVVNAGDPWRSTADGGPERPEAPEPAVLEAAADGLDEALERGIGILAVHAAVASLRDYPAFAGMLGAEWVPDASMHPPIGETVVHVHGNHPIAAGGDFTVFDERYSHLHLLDTIEPIADHEHDGVRHPLVWARESGRSRLVYDALGHDARSYESAGHRALLERAVAWLAIVQRTPADAA